MRYIVIKLLIIIVSYNISFSQVKLESHLSKKTHKDHLITQIHSIESAIQHESVTVMKALFKNYFDAEKTNYKERAEIIKNTFWKPLQVVSNKGNLKKLNKRLQLKLISYDEKSVVIKAYIFGFEKLSVEKCVLYSTGKKNRIILDYNDISSLILELGGLLK